MSDVSDKVESKKDSVRRQRSIYQVHYNIKKREEMTAKPLVVPTSSLEVQKYGRQVAGHKKTEDTKFLGLLQCNNGTILKPLIKEAQRREVDFYSRLATTADADLLELRKCVPKYFGCTHYTYGGFTQEYIILEDLCTRMLEPCIMDVKIGKRTWDPLATEEKIKNEKNKYAKCKQQYGFCIPGFQVYRLSTGQLCKYNKDYGKRLHSHAVVDALRNYLNGAGMGLCRALLLQFLSELWRIQRWARSQRRARLYCASLLLLYDAARLRQCCGRADERTAKEWNALPSSVFPPKYNLGVFKSRVNRYLLSKRASPSTISSLSISPRPQPCARAAPARRRSIHSLHSIEGSPFSGQLSSKGPVYRKLASVPLTPLSVAQATFTPPPPVTSPWTDALERLNHNHSFEHNYEDKLSKIKMNYRAMLDQLSYDSPNPNPWGTVKIIDFAHAFFNEEEEREVDDNFREGVDNFVEIFECFLRETDDQVI